MSAADTVLRHIRRQVAPAATDAALLRLYIDRLSDDAFRALVERHGPMVLRICRRRLGDEHAAEDAFQAAFLTLARRAKSIRRPESLSGWLFRTAERICRKARMTSQRRRRSEERSAARVPADPSAELSAHQLLETLDAELARLPERDQLPLPGRQ